MDAAVSQFEEDCVSRIQAHRAQTAAQLQPTDLPCQRAVPAGSFFFLGMSAGVLAARVACTCHFFSR
jgi:hypothetical protein